MGKQFESISRKVEEALVNPELDKILEALKGDDVVATRLERAINALPNDVRELGVTDEDVIKQLQTALARRFRVYTTDLENRAISKSPEALNVASFVNDFASYSGLDEMIRQRKDKDAKDPVKRIVQIARASTPLLAGIGASLTAWLNENKKPGTPSKPASGLETAAAKVDAATAAQPDKTRGNKAEQKDTAQSAKTQSAKSEASTKPEKQVKRRAMGTPAENTGSTDELEMDVNVKHKGPVTYEPNPEYTKEKLSGEEFLARYKTIKDRHQRHMFALQQVALGNVPNHFNQFEHMSIKGSSGTQVEFEMARHNQRIGTDGDYVEVPFDGPTAAAAAQLQGCSLATPWVIDQAYEKAKENGGVITFYGGQELAKKAGQSNWQRWMLSAEGMAQAFELHREEMRGKEGQVTAGHFKAIVPPRAADIQRQTLNIQGGNDGNGDNIQGYSDGFHEDSYSDASHGIRLVRNDSLTVNGKPMSWEDFNANPDYAKEFGFHVIPKGGNYAMPPALAQMIAANKHT